MAFSAAFAVVAVATAASAYETNQARRQQERANAEQVAGNKSEAMRERRMQLREERIRRANIMQASEATGTEGSSGELGALGSLSTTLQSNIGTNLGRLQTAQNISIFQQRAADALNRAETYRAVGQIASSYVNSFGKKT